MNHYFQIAYFDNDVTVDQLYRLYKEKLITVKDCQDILKIKEESVRQKFSRFKNGRIEQTVLRPWEKNRLIKILEKRNQQITEILKGYSE